MPNSSYADATAPYGAAFDKISRRFLSERDRIHLPQMGAVLLCTDMLDRQSTLISEIRHFQQNIIYQLRAPELLRALRFEEDYLWGEYKSGSEPDPAKRRDWSEFLERPGVTVAHLKALCDAWIIRYPSVFYAEGRKGPKNTEFPEQPGGRTGGGGQRDYVDAYARGKVVGSLNSYIQEIRRNARMPQDNVRQYYALTALQVLKSQILLDMLVLSKYALPLVDGRADAKSNALALAVIARTAVYHRLYDAVERLGDIHAQYERSLDIISHDMNRPMTGRRLEQGLYTAFLSDRTRDLTHEIESMADMVAGGASSNAADQDARPALVLHRWRHDARTQHAAQFDDVKTVREQIRGLGDTMSFIQTSYFMPDRPDIQGLIAHEVAHQVLVRRFQDLDVGAVASGNDALRRLYRGICRTINAFRESKSLGPESEDTAEAITREVFADILALAAMGPSYLYAFFLEVFGKGLEDALILPWSDRLSLDLLQELERDTQHMIIPALKWYVRTVALCEAAHAILAKSERTVLTRDLLEMVEGLNDELLDFLDGRYPARSRYLRENYEHLAQTLGERIQESDLCAILSAWRSKHLGLAQDALLSGVPNIEPAVSGVDKPSRPLAPELRHFLLRNLIDKKTFAGRFRQTGVRYVRASGRFFEKVSEEVEAANRQAGGRLASGASEMPSQPGDLLRAFSTIYLRHRVSSEGAEEAVQGDWPRARPSASRLLTTTQLFRRLEDIPWQCALFRGLDLCLAPAPNGSKLSRLVEDFAPGKELHQVALEFHLWDTRSTVSRLQTVFRLVKLLLGLISAGNQANRVKNLRKTLEAWRDGSEAPNEDATKADPKLVEELRALRQAVFGNAGAGSSQLCVTEYYEKAKTIAAKWGAERLIALQGQETLASNWEARGQAGRKVQTRIVYLDVTGMALVELESLLSGWVWDKKYSQCSRTEKRALDALGPLLSYLRVKRDPARPPSEDNGFEDTRTKLLQRLNIAACAPLQGATTSAAPHLSPDVRANLVQLGFASVSRLSLAGAAFDGAVEGSPKRPPPPLTLDKLLGAGAPMPSSVQEGLGGRGAQGGHTLYTPLLGRFDYLRLVHDEPRVPWRLAHLQSIGDGSPPTVDSECFAPHFERREIALAVRLLEPSVDTTQPPLPPSIRRAYPAQAAGASQSGAQPSSAEQQPFAILSIILAQRNARLHFLRRLIDWVEEMQQNPKDRPTAPSIRVPGDGTFPFTEQDECFIGEGWGDVILFLHGPQKKTDAKKRLDQIFAVQEALFDDFQVDRTELVFSPDALQVSKSTPLGPDERVVPDHYTVTASIRLKPAQDLNGSLRLFEDRLRKKVADKGMNQVNLEVTRVPGQRDIQIAFRQALDGAWMGLADILPFDLIDEVQTVIGQKVSL